MTMPMAAFTVGVTLEQWKRMEWDEKSVPRQSLEDIAGPLGLSAARLIASIYEQDERLRVANWLYETRTDRGMSLAVASMRLGVTIPTLRLWETGQTPVPPSHMVRVARAYDLPMAELYRAFALTSH